MLLPRYSLRTSLIGVTLCALLFLIAGEAIQGYRWAIVVTVAAISIIGLFVVHACWYFFASSLGKIIGVPLSPARTNQGGIQTSTDKQFPLKIDDESP